MKKCSFYLALFFSMMLFFSCSKPQSSEVAPNGVLRLQFDFESGGKPLKLNETITNKLGQRYNVENLMMYVSNFALVSDTGEFSEKDSYHFLAISRSSSSPSFLIKNIPLGKYKQLKFAFGVDSLRNSSTQKVGDLDANGNMGWPWTQGYKFMSFEGRHFLDNQNEGTELVFHIGENVNYKPLNLSLLKENAAGFEIGETEKLLRIKVNVDKLFDGKTVIDFKEINRIMAGENAVIMANNIAEMFEL